MIGRIFGGPGERINLVPMAKNINQQEGDWAKLEREWEKSLQAGSQVKVEITPVYSGSAMRPDSFKVTSWIDGVLQPRRVIGNR